MNQARALPLQVGERKKTRCYLMYTEGLWAHACEHVCACVPVCACMQVGRILQGQLLRKGVFNLRLKTIADFPSVQVLFLWLSNYAITNNRPGDDEQGMKADALRYHKDKGLETGRPRWIISERTCC